MLTTLPWHLKAVILGFDTVMYLANAKQRPESNGEPQDESGMLGKTLPEVLMYRSMLRVCMLYLIMTFVILAPSVLVSVKSREKTNTVVSGVISLLGFVSYVIIAATENIVSVEHACYSLQFCLCYASYCVWQEAAGNRLLFACNDLVKYVSAVATYAFPVILSHALVNGMHLSPYIIPISFAGEIAGACSRATTLALDAFIHILS
jgi:hypothetical protein